MLERSRWHRDLPQRQSEAAPKLLLADVVGLANITQVLLGRFASVQYKDGRAPQNLVPIAGLERELRHRLGMAPVLYRDLRAAAEGVGL